MAKAGYSAVTGGAIALTGGTAKTVLGLKGHANFGLDLKKVRIGFDGVTATNVPVLVELGYCTWASNSPGTNSTSVTPAQIYGRATAVGATAGKNWTTEPTAITTVEEWLLTPAGGLVLYDFPLGDTPDSAVSEGFVLRCNAPAGVNVRAGLQFERC
ncbi:hypothetical protein [Actinomadura nitritigenes]|uniref:hypothetical protein n=1 Tax=Actinomadura nitritigenes TaxID=134602 RepID=UPI003D946977